MPPLESTQRAFFAALQMPLRGTSRSNTDLTPNDEGHPAAFLETAENLLKAGPNLSAPERLELYHRQYWFRLLDSIAEDFPRLREAAGEALFWEMMEAYIQHYPSGSFTLRHFGRRMEEFLENWKRLDPDQQTWFPAIVAIEYADMEIFEAAARQPLDPAELATATLELQPHLKLLALPVPADGPVPGPGDAESFARRESIRLALWRGPQGRMLQRRLDPVEHELLLRIRTGGTLEEIFAEPVSREPEPEEIQRWFGDWQAHGWLTARDSAELIDFPQTADHDAAADDWAGVDKMGSQAREMGSVPE